jgi:hypothetical protein
MVVAALSDSNLQAIRGALGRPASLDRQRWRALSDALSPLGAADCEIKRAERYQFTNTRSSDAPERWWRDAENRRHLGSCNRAKRPLTE